MKLLTQFSVDKANRHFLQINMSNNVIINKTLETKIYPGTQTQIHFHLIGTCYRYASIIWQLHTLCNISPCWYSGTIASAFLIWAQTTRRTFSFLMPSTRLFLHTLWSLPCKHRRTEFTFSYSKLLCVSHIILGKKTEESAPQNLLPFLNEANISACQPPPLSQVISQLPRKITNPFCYKFHLLQCDHTIWQIGTSVLEESTAPIIFNADNACDTEIMYDISSQNCARDWP